MSHTHITLRVQVSSFDTILDALVDKERVPIDVNLDKLIQFLVGDFPSEVLPAYIDQCAVFLEQVCNAGSEADLIREYLGDLATASYDSADLLLALSALTHKDLLVKESVKNAGAWITAMVAALDEPYITKSVIATLLSRKDLPEEEGELRALFLSLL